MNEIAQDASSVGNALKTISMRIRAMDEETGEFDDTLQTISGDIYELTHGQVSIMQDANTYKDIYTILDDISKVWGSLTDKEHATLTETLFGKHRANIGSAIISNFEQARKAIETMENADGGAMAEMEVIMDSISYKTNTFKETLVGIAQNSFSQDFMKSMVDSGTRVLNVFDDLTPSISFILKQFANLLELVTKLADTIGGIPLLIAGIGLKNVGNIKTWITDLKQVTMAVDSFKGITQSFKGTGLKAVIDDITVTKYATSIKGLTLEQANLALSTTQLSATEKERVLVEAGLIAQTETLTATDAVYRLQQKLGNDLSAKEILISAGLVTQKEIEDGTTIKLTADKLKEALATGQLSLENYKLIASTFGVEGANYGEAVSFEVLGVSIKKAAVELWAFLTTNPVGWAILAGAAIAGIVAVVDLFTVSLEESKEQLKDLKDECNGIETDLKSMNDELKTTVDRMKELEGKDTLTFTEKEEYDNLVKTNKELQRKIDLLKLEQETKNKEKNKSFVQTMEKDAWDNKYYKTASGISSTPTDRGMNEIVSEMEYANAQLKQRKSYAESLAKLYDKLPTTNTEKEKRIIQSNIDWIENRLASLDKYIADKNKEWGEISAEISYISNPTTDDDKAVNEWLDYINDFQDQMAIAMGGSNAKSNAFNRIVDNWKFDNVVQGLEDLGKEGKVTAEMLDDPKYDAFIQKLVLLGVIDSADNLDDIALAFNGFGDAVSATDKAKNSIYDFVEASEELKTAIDDTFGNQSTIQSAFDKIQEGTSLSADEVRKLIELCPQLSSEFVKTADGYTIGADKLIKANESVVESTKNSLQERADYLKSFINADYKTDVITGAFEAKKYNEWQKSVASAKTELEGLELILSMFGLTVEDTDDKLEELSKTTSNKVSLISSAMSELNDTGYISSSTYAEIVEMGGNFAECLEIQNGKLTLNIQKLKELEAQEYDNAIAANNLAIAEMQASINSGYDYIRLQEKINELKAQNAFLQTARDEIVNAKPDDNNKSTKDEEPTKVTDFKKELAKKQHLVAMKELSEEEYLNWLDGAYKEAYAGLEGYDDDLYKYEEEIFSKRRELAEKAFDDTIDGIEKEIDALEKLKDNASIDADKIIDPKATEELKKFNEEMQKTFGLGNVDLTKRPKVSAEAMRKAGYDAEDGETATVYSSTEFIWQGDDKNGKYVAVHYTPILPDGTVLDDESLRKYLYETLESSQDILDTDKNNLGIVLKVDTDFNISDKDIQSLETDKPTQNIQDIIKACDDWDVALHEVQEQWMELDNKIASSNVTNGDNIYEIIDKQINLYNKAIAEIDKRIAELEASGLVGIEDEIEELNKQRDDLLDKVYNLSKDRTSIGVDNEIKYWEEMQSKQNEFYDKQIEKLKKQKKLLEDKNDEEERAKDLAEKQLELRKAQIALEDARRNRNVLVYTAGGAYSYEADQTAIAEAEEDVKKAEEDLAKTEKDILKDGIDRQIDILEEQKDKDSEYYDTVVKLLEDMSGKNKVQSESNRSIWGELLATDAGQKALGQIDPDKLQELLDSGFLVKKDGKYSLGEGKPNEEKSNEVFKAGTDVIKMLSTLLHKSESEILANDKLMNAVSGGSGIWNSLAMPSQSALSELTKAKSTAITNYNNSKISNTYHVDKIDVGYSGDDFNGMLEQAFNAMNQQITINGNKVAYGN